MNEPSLPVVEMTRAARLADKLENNERLKKRLFRALVVFLIMIFLGFLAWGVNKVLLTEGTQLLPEEYGNSASPSPVTGSEAVALLEKLMSEASDDSKTKLSVTTSLKIDDGSVEVRGDDDGLLREALLYAKDTMLDNLSSYYEDKSTGFGEPLADLLMPVRFGTADLESWATAEDGPNRTLTFNLFGEPLESVNDNIAASVGMSGAQDFTEYVKEQISPVAEIYSSTITCVALTINATENRLNDQLNDVTYTREYMVGTDVRFIGDLASLGTQHVSFKFISKTDYAFTWAGVTLSHTVLWMEKGDTEVIEAHRTADETLGVTWTSSDDSIASIDSEGYVKGHQTSEKPVTVTATVKYLGHTYTAECLVYVVEPVKEVALNTNELSLAAGKTAVLTPTVSPENATVKDVRWFASDEAVATVDENGLVTAVGKGTCEVYCITLSGNYKRTCTVTVRKD